MKKILATILLFASIVSCKNNEKKTSTTSASTEVKTNKKPNIIFIMSDDHTTQGIGAYGSRLASLNPTPTIDRIGNEGIIFENAFCTN